MRLRNVLVLAASLVKTRFCSFYLLTGILPFLFCWLLVTVHIILMTTRHFNTGDLYILS